MGIALAIASLFVTVAGQVKQSQQAKKTANAQKRQNEKVNASNEAKASTARRKEIRAERVRRAQMNASAEASGASGSSTALSGQGRSAGAAAERIGSTAGSLSFTNALSRGSQSIADSQQREQLFATVSAIGSSVFSAAGGAGAIDGAFAATSAAPKTTVPITPNAINTPMGGR